MSYDPITAHTMTLIAAAFSPPISIFAPQQQRGIPPSWHARSRNSKAAWKRRGKRARK